MFHTDPIGVKYALPPQGVAAKVSAPPLGSGLLKASSGGLRRCRRFVLAGSSPACDYLRRVTGTSPMETGPLDSTPPPPEVAITEQDVLFDCPRCGKSMVVDQRAAGLIVGCPQCHVDVMVPPKQPTLGDAVPDLAALAEQIGAHDILFECPECGKSMVIEDSAAGAYVECPRCKIYVVVPGQQPAPGPDEDERRNGAASLNDPDAAP